ncbi:hypothetical protein PRN20_06075 [Devosia sp. ZB163]|uniref:hypothetical protein n=1 Tax=Devosia sp. ZB163 TaxID=3025938 RepID=UPI00236129BF|nr:hypothetical protein [Devosia sp. ZB163]MDC9823291.1 hypothetical protein [Devosia sp. ZB163]
MFGYAAGGAPQVLVGMIAERDAARNRWPFLTTLDLSVIHNEPQLVTMVKDRTGKSRSEARGEVHEWLKGYEARLLAATSLADTSIERWSDDGGAASAPFRRHRPK